MVHIQRRKELVRIVPGDVVALHQCDELLLIHPTVEVEVGSSVKKFDRRGTEPFELFRSELGQNSIRIEQNLLEFNHQFMRNSEIS